MTARKKIIAGNWKMNKTVAEAIELSNTLKRELCDIDDVGIILCPPFTALDEVAEVIYESNLELGAQNMHWEGSGAFTGEVSPLMIKELGCKYVILGHSERRAYFHETNEIVDKKARSAVDHGLTPIVCVGETLAERESNQTIKVVADQVTNSLRSLKDNEIRRIIIAYEPVWAIGTGRNATPEQAQEVHEFIRKTISGLYSTETASEVTIQYGGSVKPANAKELLSQKDIDGALVGGASLEAKGFTEIVKAARI